MLSKNSTESELSVASRMLSDVSRSILFIGNLSHISENSRILW